MAKRLVIRSVLAVALLARAALVANPASGEPPAPTGQAPRGVGGVVVPDPGRAPARVERSVAAALNWLARHQGADGNWSTKDFHKQCKDDSCSGPGELKADNAATAAALLTFLAAGQTHKSKGPYRKNIFSGFYYLIRNQKTDGSLTGGMDLLLDNHSLATIAMCECYRLSKDQTIGSSAQQAINFILGSPAPNAERWQYHPGKLEDTSVIAWQWLALQSGLRCRLEIDEDQFVARAKWLREKTLAADRRDIAAAAVGLLAVQTLGTDPDRLDVTMFFRRLNAAAPKSGQPRDCIACLLASQALHAAGGKPWQNWLPKLQAALVENQTRQGCAEGSWDPDQPAADAWGRDGGRVLVTAMSALCLEVEFNRLPLFKRDAALDAAPPAADKTPDR